MKSQIHFLSWRQKGMVSRGIQEYGAVRARRPFRASLRACARGCGRAWVPACSVAGAGAGAGACGRPPRSGQGMSPLAQLGPWNGSAGPGLGKACLRWPSSGHGMSLRWPSSGHGMAPLAQVWARRVPAGPALGKACLLKALHATGGDASMWDAFPKPIGGGWIVISIGADGPRARADFEEIS